MSMLRKVALALLLAYTGTMLAHAYRLDTADSGNTMCLEDASCSPGSEVVLSVLMDSSKPMSGFQFNLILPEGVTAVGASASGRAEGRITPMGNMVGSVYKLSAFNAGFEPVESGEGEVLGIKLKVADAVAEGDYTVTIGSIIMFAEDGEEIKAADRTATLMVQPKHIEVQSIALNKEKLSLHVGGEEQLSATVLPDNATDKTVTWTSSDEKTATVSTDGKVTAVAVGTATITATAADGSGVSAGCVVTVNPVLKLDIIKGWNWISTFLDEAVAVDELFANGAVRVVSQTQEAVADPQYGVVGNLVEIEPGVCCKVYSDAEFTVSWSGVAVDVEERPVVLRKGWNWIGWPHCESRGIGSAVVNAEEGDCIVSQDAFASYSGGAWSGVLRVLEPGRGYLYRSASDKVLELGL